MKDTEDRDEVATCLREAEEEIGLPGHQVQVLARLLPSINRRQILVSPIVGLVTDPDFSPTVNPDEVEAAFLLPLDRFLSDRDHTAHMYSNHGISWTIHFFEDLVGERLFRTWGLTASMCVNLAVAVLRQEPDFSWDDGNTVDNPYATQAVYLQKYSEDRLRQEAATGGKL